MITTYRPHGTAKYRNTRFMLPVSQLAGQNGKQRAGYWCVGLSGNAALLQGRDASLRGDSANHDSLSFDNTPAAVAPITGSEPIGERRYWSQGHERSLGVIHT